MIFTRALRRELVSVAGAVFMTLFTVTVTMMLIRILGQAAKGRVASSDVVALIGFSALTYSPIILILTGFITVLLVITRSYQDSEMVVWFASGLSLTRWLKPILEFAAPVVLLVSLLCLVVTPWAFKQNAEYRARFEKREDLARVAPGRFQESAVRDRVFFVEKSEYDTEHVENVFIHNLQDEDISVIVAKEGTVRVDENGDRFLVLGQGQRYEKLVDPAVFLMTEFDRYTSLITEGRGMGDFSDTASRGMTTPELIRDPDPRRRGELLWRIAQPIMALILMFLAVPLGFVNPRAGRSFNLLLALLLYVSYNNINSVIQASVSRGRLSLAMGWWPLHLLIALIVLALYSWRLTINHRYHPFALWNTFRRGKTVPDAPGPGQQEVVEEDPVMEALPAQRPAMRTRQHFPGVARAASVLRRYFPSLPVMSVLQRYFTSQIMKAVFFVLAAFLALFAFFDLVSEISGIGRGKYKVQHAFLYVLMNIPGYTYELMPVAVLIGTIYVLARFASNSEYTIMRVSSLSTSQACLILVKIGAAFLVFTCVVGELITPYTSTRATEFRARKMERDMKVEGRFRSGVWSKDMVRAGGARGDVIGSRFINIRALKADRTLEGIYLYEFDPHRQLSRMVFAKTGHYLGDHTWQLNQVSESVVTPPAKRGGPRFPVGAPRFASRTMDTQALSSDLTPNILSVLSVDAARMSAYDLAVYNRHMEANKQDATGYQIAFWKKIVYPFSVFVMMALALPFAYLHFRAGGISIKIFSGIMIGVLFLLLNSLFSHLGLLNTWPAFFTASLPSFLFLLLAAGALWWVERH